MEAFYRSINMPASLEGTEDRPDRRTDEGDGEMLLFGAADRGMHKGWPQAEDVYKIYQEARVGK